MANTTMIQIRNVPPELHRELKSRTAREGLSLSDFILRDLRELAAVPPQRELLAHIHSHPLPDPKVNFVAIIRKLRGPI